MDNKETPENLLRSLSLASVPSGYNDESISELEAHTNVGFSVLRLLKENVVQQQRKQRGSSSQRNLRLSVLCIALEKAITNAKNETKMALLNHKDLALTLSHLVEIFLDWQGNTNVRDVVLSKSVRIMCDVCNHSAAFPNLLLGPLSSILTRNMPSDIRIDTSRAISSLAIHQDIKKYPKVLPEIANLLSTLISTLTTAAGSTTTGQLDEVLDSLWDLCCTSKLARGKMAKRRDTVSTVVDLLENPQSQLAALKISSRLIRCKESFFHLRSSTMSTGVILLQGLAKASRRPSEPQQSQELALAILIAALALEGWRRHEVEIILDALVFVANADSSVPLRTKAAVAFCRYLRHVNVDHAEDLIKDFISNVMTYANANASSVREEALETVYFLVDKAQMASEFIAEDTFFLTLAELLHEGSKDEREATIAILFECAKDPTHCRCICCCPALLAAIVDTATSGKLTSKGMYLKYVELLLLIMADPQNHFFIKEHTELLPWLATFANAMTSEDTLKKNVVRAIIQLSSCFIENGMHNRIHS